MWPYRGQLHATVQAQRLPLVLTTSLFIRVFQLIHLMWYQFRGITVLVPGMSLLKMDVRH